MVIISSTDILAPVPFTQCRTTSYVITTDLIITTFLITIMLTPDNLCLYWWICQCTSCLHNKRECRYSLTQTRLITKHSSSKIPDGGSFPSDNFTRNGIYMETKTIFS
ncbi:hypothetical protein V8G54_027543 [Vigna mungo]|uniref:Uncharacterized protein n=1 Tax=Vigna mungo TaxID=3915 RepID=A0AAQ3RR37_VIGMU